VSVGKIKVRAEKQSRTWCVRTEELAVAIRARKADPPTSIVMGMDLCDH
jgi:hypothetical protein